MGLDWVQWLLTSLALMLSTVILYENSRHFKYYTKWIIYLVGSALMASIFIPVMLFRPRDSRNALLPAWGCRMVAKLIHLQFEVKGHENIVKDEGTVVLINHQSFIDLIDYLMALWLASRTLFVTNRFVLNPKIVLAELWPIMERCTVISKKEIFYMWPFGLASWLWGTVFINRKSSKDAQGAVNAAAETITSKKSRILMFPEGSRWGGPQLRPFKKGAFHIAIESQAPLQPVVVRSYTFLDHANYKFESGSSIIQILPAIPTKGLKREDMEDLIRQAQDTMQAEYDKLNNSQ